MKESFWHNRKSTRSMLLLLWNFLSSPGSLNSFHHYMFFIWSCFWYKPHSGKKCTCRTVKSFYEQLTPADQLDQLYGILPPFHYTVSILLYILHYTVTGLNWWFKQHAVTFQTVSIIPAGFQVMLCYHCYAGNKLIAELFLYCLS